EADVELRPRIAGDHVAGVRWCGERREFEVGRRELLASVVEMNRIERGNDSGEGRYRILAALGISDMALNPRHLDPHIDRPAAPDLHGITKTGDRGRLADQDHVGPDLPLVEPVDDPGRPVDRIAFLIA